MITIDSSIESDIRRKLFEEGTVTILDLPSNVTVEEFFYWCEINIGIKTSINPIYNILYGKILGDWYIIYHDENMKHPIKLWVKDPDKRTLLLLTWC